MVRCHRFSHILYEGETALFVSRSYCRKPHIQPLLYPFAVCSARRNSYFEPIVLINACRKPLTFHLRIYSAVREYLNRDLLLHHKRISFCDLMDAAFYIRNEQTVSGAGFSPLRSKMKAIHTAAATGTKPILPLFLLLSGLPGG